MDNKQRKNLWTGLGMLILLPLLMAWVFRGHCQEIWDNIRAIRAGELLLLCAWRGVQRLACLGIDRLPDSGAWARRKPLWKADLADLYGQLSSALILYRTATFFVPFVLSVVVFLIIQRRASAGGRHS